MNQEINNNFLNVVFHQLRSETLFDELFPSKINFNAKTKINSRFIDKMLYQSLAKEVNQPLTNDELENVRSYALNQATKINSMSSYNLNSFFGLLVNSAEKMIKFENKEPVCKTECLLEFREISKILGQEVLSTSLLAKYDLEYNTHTPRFTWPVTMHSDNIRLRQMLKKGISENHFHLNGSVPVFFLSWVSIVNHPDKIRSFFNDKNIKKNMEYNLYSKKIITDHDTIMKMKDKLYLASYIRAVLFEKVALNNETIDVFDKLIDYNKDFRKSNLVSGIVQNLRYQYGYKFNIVNGQSKVLDYAIENGSFTKSIHFDDTHHNRILNGERKFLYECFKKCFDNTLNVLEQDIFYLYLLIQNEFYSELIQINNAYGFDNFSQYQDRKDMFFEKFIEYSSEAYRLTILANIEESSIKSFETRISLQNNVKSQYQKIYSIDHSYYFSKFNKLPIKKLDVENYKYNHFFVLHFIKLPYKFNSNDKYCYYKPRNYNVRMTIKRQALALYESLKRNQYLCSRICGIDACANEKGCRPETFATEFRFLREGVKKFNINKYSVNNNSANLRVTFHAGEDFIGIIYGLRAIDETVTFLQYERGDRLGHALALGISPVEYYSNRNNTITIAKQDILDNIVWLLFKCQEFNIGISAGLQSKLTNCANEYLDDIYGNIINININNILLLYFNAWQLRGDHPSLYETIKLPKIKFYNEYSIQKTQSNPKLKAFRTNPIIREICNAYHFNNECKFAGLINETFVLDSELISIIEQIQNKMQFNLMRLGIAVECNLTSNVLIGTFKEYNKHPLFRFNNYGLESIRKKVKSSQMHVSINTDDQGIFATSLENEYAMLANTMESMCKKRNKDKLLFSNDEVYNYVEHIRVLSNSQSFHKDADEIFGC